MEKPIKFLEDNITDKLTAKSNKMNIQEISKKYIYCKK